MPLRKSHIDGGVEEFGIAARYEGIRLAYWSSVNDGSGFYDELISDIEDRRNFYWLKIQESQ